MIKNPTPRTFLFGGKAAPGYRMAKLIIKLVCTVADLVNERSRRFNKLLHAVIFVPDYSVSVGTEDLSGGGPV